jgi:hypothetical protein
MTSLEYDDEEKLDQIMPIRMEQKPNYPCNACFALTDKEFDKLDADVTEVKKGDLFHMVVMARVSSVSRKDDSNGKCCRVEFQIEDMAVESEDDEVEEDEDDTKAKSRRY